MIIGSVKLKSKRAAFSISSAKEGGVKVKEVAAMREKDLRVEVERARSWGLVILRILGKESCGIWSLGLVLAGREEEGRVRRDFVRKWRGDFRKGVISFLTTQIAEVCNGQEEGVEWSARVICVLLTLTHIDPTRPEFIEAAPPI
ncbi:hypothetical protein OIU74_028163 [Salix koriyanagi]|uniref:Uncharacterized protein n=1 Tax=Salix koriyanagi TaxID=2511006 RepID=A0A9Q0VB04_9ROSI|nr:hypothetical protein OIU74_028163 [Salix koriyanagi]